jgi:16S rRNA (adenine1518-N6/adenine1519-N6)-dimethyltransferase
VVSAPQTRSQVRDLLERHGVSPIKRLGQNFLVDPNIVGKIVGLIDAPPGSPVVEIGPGTGTLTSALVGRGFAVRAYEIDAGLAPLLGEVLGDTVDVRFEDATRVDLRAELEGGPWWFVANLPYNVGTALLLDTLRRVPQVGGYVVMVQREVADRLVAKPGTKEYGVPSVVARLFGTPSFAFSVPPQVFIPRPNVESAVITIRRRGEVTIDHQRAVDLAQAAFNQRRKMLRSSLRSAFADPAQVLASAAIAETARAEELTPDDYLRLARMSG